MSESTISTIKLGGQIYNINDSSKATIESVENLTTIVTENKTLLTNTHSKLDELLNKINGNSTAFYKCVAVGEKVEENKSSRSIDRQYTDYYYMEFTPSQDAINEGIPLVEDVTGLYWGNLWQNPKF